MKEITEKELNNAEPAFREFYRKVKAGEPVSLKEIIWAISFNRPYFSEEEIAHYTKQYREKLKPQIEAEKEKARQSLPDPATSESGFIVKALVVDFFLPLVDIAFERIYSNGQWIWIEK